MKKILFLNYEYPPLGGGAGVATEALLREFSKNPNVEVHLVTSAVGPALEHERVGGEVYVHRLPIGKDPKKLHSQSLRDIVVYTWRAWRFLVPFLRSQRTPFEVTLAFFTIPCGFIAYSLKWWIGLPYVVSLRGADVPGFSEKYDRFYFFLKPFIRYLWKKSERVIPNSMGLKRLAENTAPHQVMEIIENGVDIERFSPRQSEEHMTLKPVVFLSVARLTKRKGIDLLLQAFGTMAQESPVPAKLLLAGDGEELGPLKELAKQLGITESIEFLGRVDHAQVALLYNKVDVFVLPSKNEGMSNAALEALASGLPLIVSRTGGMSELVQNEVNGFLVDPQHRQDFSQALLELVQSGEKRKKFGSESRRRAEERSWKHVADQFLDVLET